MRFKYSTTSPTQNEFDSLPRIPLTLLRDERSIEAVGLLDSGSTVNVLPYEIGLQLGGVWDIRRAIIQLTGNLSYLKAMPFAATALPPLSLQKEYINLVERQRFMLSRANSHMREINNLFNSLMHRAFRGEL